MPDDDDVPIVDYAAPAEQSSQTRHPVIVALCLTIGAGLVGIGIPCLAADGLYERSIQRNGGIILVGAALYTIGVWLKRRRYP